MSAPKWRGNRVPISFRIQINPPEAGLIERSQFRPAPTQSRARRFNLVRRQQRVPLVSFLGRVFFHHGPLPRRNLVPPDDRTTGIKLQRAAKLRRNYQRLARKLLVRPATGSRISGFTDADIGYIDTLDVTLLVTECDGQEDG